MPQEGDEGWTSFSALELVLFYRAFQRWTRESPRAYMKRLAR
jgi:hypothetical protein